MRRGLGILLLSHGPCSLSKLGSIRVADLSDRFLRDRLINLGGSSLVDVAICCEIR